MNPYKGGDSGCAVKIGKEIIFSGGYGYDDDGYQIMENTSIYTNDGETFADLPQMPFALASHCMVALDGDDWFVTGGRNDSYPDNDSDKSLLYHSDKREWEELPGLPTPRIALMCGMAHNSNGDQEVIAVGGFDYGEDPLRAVFAYQLTIYYSIIFYVCFFLLATEDTYSNVVEIFNIQSRVWRTGGLSVVLILYTFHLKNPSYFISGSPLPTPLSFSTVVPLSESFLLVGGFIDDQPFPLPENTNAIYKYEDESWTELETKIPYYVQFPVAMMVDIDIFPPCPGEVGSSVFINPGH